MGLGPSNLLNREGYGSLGLGHYLDPSGFHELKSAKPGSEFFRPFFPGGLVLNLPFFPWIDKNLDLLVG